MICRFVLLIGRQPNNGYNSSAHFHPAWAVEAAVEIPAEDLQRTNIAVVGPGMALFSIYLALFCGSLWETGKSPFFGQRRMYSLPSP